MSQYHGGKARTGKRINNIILNYINDNNNNIQTYCEPFCGMCGVYRHIAPKLNLSFTLLAGDQNVSLILMWKELQSGWKPSDQCSEEHYNQLRANGISSAEKGFIGHGQSKRGIYFSSYDNRDQTKKAYASKSIKISDIGSNNLKHVQFSSGDYTQFSYLTNSMIYCDPPYTKQSRYYDEDDNRLSFDRDAFFEWVRIMLSKNNIILISDQTIPDSFNSRLLETFTYDKLYILY